MKVYAFVPAKSNSERIENKNMRILAGERLYARALKTLLRCKEIDKVFLDTESEDMYKMIDYLPVEFMKRDVSLANNNTDGHQMFLNEVNSYPDADIYVQLLCTSPFIKSETIDNAIRILKEKKEYDSVVLMKKDRYYFWENNKPSYNISHIPNSKDLPETITESMGLYVSTKESAIKTNRRYGDNPYLLFGSLEELIDVNTQEDLEFAKIYAKGQKEKEHQKLTLMKHLITSPMLSDIIDDLQYETGLECGAVLNNWKCNLSNVKLFGRASTLKLRKLNDNEDYNGIYNALDSYKEISQNDIIIVENELKQYAYFGDLNARLAIRAGASAAIIDGATRDLSQTKALGFPVFARNYNASDVRRKATLDYINKPIKIENTTIKPKDLIFMDECAMVVIYQQTEKLVMERILKSIEQEKNVSQDILLNKDTNSIINDRGYF